MQMTIRSDIIRDPHVTRNAKLATTRDDLKRGQKALEAEVISTRCERDMLEGEAAEAEAVAAHKHSQLLEAQRLVVSAGGSSSATIRISLEAG